MKKLRDREGKWPVKEPVSDRNEICHCLQIMLLTTALAREGRGEHCFSNLMELGILRVGYSHKDNRERERQRKTNRWGGGMGKKEKEQKINVSNRK